jgi:hypothetical protein
VAIKNEQSIETGNIENQRGNQEMLPVSMGCSFLIATLVFYVAGFSGLFILDCHFGFLCCQFLWIVNS